MALVTVLPLIISVAGLFAWIVYLAYGPSEYRGPPAGSQRGPVSVHILVLGDLGRSPRMTYHALSIAKHQGQVHLIGYLETSPHPDLVDSPNITIVALPPAPRRPARIPFILFAPWKVLAQVYHLVVLLTYGLPASQWLLVQNPPSIPTLAVALLACYLRNTRLIVDWHNYGWTILAGTRGPRHPLVFFSRLYETYLGRLGHLHLTVTRAMARQLREPPYHVVGRPLVPVHDRPAAIFQPLGPAATARAHVLHRVIPSPYIDLIPEMLGRTRRLVVSSTSWTPDEDFSLLLDALVLYASSQPPDPVPMPLLAIITGKGPERDMYMEQVADLTASGKLPGVLVATAFLPFADYAGLLAAADLGVCLHMSSSGVDLPMKVVDMFGAGLPVAAYAGYESFSELVREGENGRGFTTPEELAAILRRLLSGGRGQQELEMLKRGAVAEGSRRWDEEWDSTVGKVMGLVS